MKNPISYAMAVKMFCKLVYRHRDHDGHLFGIRESWDCARIVWLTDWPERIA